MDNLNVPNENEELKNCYMQDNFTNDDFVKKLGYDLSRVKLENQRKDDLIKELTSFNCQEEDTKIDEIENGTIIGSSVRAELAVYQLKVNEIQNELLERVSENQNLLLTIKILKQDHQHLLELNARQKATLETFKNSIEKRNNLSDGTKGIIDQYLKVIEKSQTEINFYRKEIEIKDSNFKELNEWIRERNMRNRENSNHMEVLLSHISEGEELKGIKEASEKIKVIIAENKNMKSQIKFNKTHVASFKCEQKISRETIIRLANDLKFERDLRIGVEQKLFNYIQEAENTNRSDYNINQQIECLKSQISDMRDALAKAQEEDMKKTLMISKLMEETKMASPLFESLNFLDIFITKAEEILSNFYNGKPNEESDIEWVLQCLRKLMSQLKEEPNEQ